MGTDITSLIPQTLSILSNPAIIALNQDPLGMPAFRVWQKPIAQENQTYSVDAYTQGTTQFWTCQLNGGDYAVAFVNGGASDTVLTATIDDVFVDLVTTGNNHPVPQVAQTWDVYDLWANRMSNVTAQAIISGNFTQSTNVTSEANSTSTMPVQTYNSTAMSYADGLKANETALLGVKTATLSPGGMLTASVRSHGIVVYRLRSQGMGKGMRKRDEL